MLFSDEFIATLKEDPVRGTISLCGKTFEHLDLESQEGWRDSDFTILIEAYALLVEVIESGLLPVRLEYPVIANGGSNECGTLFEFIHEVREICVGEEAKLLVSALRNRFKTSLSSGFLYEFSQGDLDRVQALVNQLRELIADAGHFEKEHQQRLLRRLEKLQSELHKKVSDLDRFWGLIGDAGVVIGKLGEDAKPIVDRIREITDIVWQTQSRAEELPSGTKLPQLEHRSPASIEEL
ncbi:hypothetical protein [Iodobacter ciconiae]|uniref:Uncharacterized protein n=1 Tax=Iodobacter ciconiae TaxID=2496266 RepID=A0A3S8ZUR5_9NEIS|nr:hypothetical protein [Iodobacter ciconiae]AZN37189.1 hypothetical protein EJO50_12275 [Iodobacter ciconiae]